MVNKIRLTERRRLLDIARIEAQHHVRTAIEPALKKQWRKLEKFLRKANLRNRIIKADGVGNLLKVDDQGCFKKELLVATLSGLFDAVDIISSAENKVWKSRGYSEVRFVPEMIIEGYQVESGKPLAGIADELLKRSEQIITDWYMKGSEGSGKNSGHEFRGNQYTNKPKMAPFGVTQKVNTYEEVSASKIDYALGRSSIILANGDLYSTGGRIHEDALPDVGFKNKFDDEVQSAMSQFLLSGGLRIRETNTTTYIESGKLDGKALKIYVGKLADDQKIKIFGQKKIVLENSETGWRESLSPEMLMFGKEYEKQDVNSFSKLISDLEKSFTDNFVDFIVENEVANVMRQIESELEKSGIEGLLKGGKGSGENLGHTFRGNQWDGTERKNSIFVHGKNKAANRIREQADKLPQKYFKDISTVSVEKTYSSSLEGGNGFIGLYNTETHSIKIDADFADSESQNKVSIFHHEIGHHVDYLVSKTKEGKRMRKEWNPLCKNEYRKSRFMSRQDSMREEPAETFAEMFKVYYYDNGGDKKKFHSYLAAKETGYNLNEDNLRLEKPFFDMLATIKE